MCNFGFVFHIFKRSGTGDGGSLWNFRKLWNGNQQADVVPSGDQWQIGSSGVNGMDSGIECTLTEFNDDTQLCGTDNMLEGRDNIHRDLDRLGLCKLHEVQQDQV